VRFHESALKWDEFQYPLDKVTGILDIMPDHWEIREFRGTRNQGEVRASGRSFATVPERPYEDCRIAFEIHGANVGIDQTMQEAVQAFPGLARTWSTFKPAGRMNFLARIERLPSQPQDLDMAVDVRGGAINPTFFPYPLHDLNGRFRYSHGKVR